ncbi:MAG: hypothetical protein R2697_20105 [Ilumatobacteraceae bacterium]
MWSSTSTEWAVRGSVTVFPRVVWQVVWVGGDDEPVRSSVVVVVSGGQFGDGGGEFVGERRTVGSRCEADLRVDRERREPSIGVAREATESGEVAHQPSAERHQVAGRQSVADEFWACRRR